MATASDGGEAHVPFDPDIDFGPDETDVGERRRRTRLVQAFTLAALALGGVLGAVSRYAVSLALPTGSGRFPWATFLVNISGSALLGFILILVIEQFPRGRLARPMIGSGFIGAYTTFSTFMVEAVELVRNGYLETAVTYFVATVLGGLLAVWIGMAIARVVLRAERWMQEEAS